jgi:hypothetical protein
VQAILDYATLFLLLAFGLAAFTSRGREYARVCHLSDGAVEVFGALMVSLATIGLAARIFLE